MPATGSRVAVLSVSLPQLPRYKAPDKAQRAHLARPAVAGSPAPSPKAFVSHSSRPKITPPAASPDAGTPPAAPPRGALEGGRTLTMRRGRALAMLLARSRFGSVGFRSRVAARRLRCLLDRKVTRFSRRTGRLYTCGRRIFCCQQPLEPHVGVATRGLCDNDSPVAKHLPFNFLELFLVGPR